MDVPCSVRAGRCKGTHAGVLQSIAQFCLAGGECCGKRYISRRPSMAFSIVTSSVYSMSLPTGMPMAMRVTRSP